MSYLRLRGGVSVGEEPPAAPAYGPAYGRQWVVDNAVPRAVTQPSGTITTVNPGNNVATKVATAGVGGTLWFTAGVHTIASKVTLLANQRLYLQSAAGFNRTSSDTAIIDGNSGTHTVFESEAGGVEIHGGIFRNQGTGSTPVAGQSNLRLAGGYLVTPYLVEDAEFGPNVQTGCRFSARFTCRRCYSHDNGYYGVHSNEGPTNITYDERYQGCLVEHNHLGGNNGYLLTNDGGSVSQGKWGATRASTFRYNYVHDNWGAGMWWDTDHSDHDIYDNVVENNRGPYAWGMFLEYSRGGNWIRNNHLAGNAQGYGADSWFSQVQLMVTGCDGTLGSPRFSENRVSNNIIIGSGKLMGVGERAAAYVPAKFTRFYDNDLWWNGTLTTDEIAGGESNSTTGVYDPVNGNTFEGNRYHIHTNSSSYARWQWVRPGFISGGTKTWLEWNAYGHDVPDGLYEVVTF